MDTVRSYDNTNSAAGFAERLLSLVAESDDALDSILVLGTETLANPIMITDRGWNLISMSRGVEIPDDEDWSELMTHGSLPPESVTTDISGNLVETVESSEKPFVYKRAGMKYARMIKSLGCGSKISATVSLLEYYKPFGKSDRELLDIFCNAAAAELKKRGSAKFSRGLLYEGFLESVLNGRLSDSDTVSERAKMFGLGFHGDCTVYVFDISDYDPNKFSITYMRDTLERMINGGKALIFDHKIVILAGTPRGRDALTAEMNALSEFLTKHGIRCGISRKCPDLAELRFYYTQSIDALRIGTYLDSEKCLYTYEEYSMYHAAEQLCSANGMKAYCHPALMRLIKYDEKYGTSFTRSLYMYVANFRSMSKASAAMGLHRNTLLYHIQRAGDIMETDMSNYNTSQLIELSFRLIEYEKKTRFTAEREGLPWIND